MKQLYILYSNIKDYKKALFFHEKFTEFKDSIFNKKKNEQILKIKAEYEDHKLQREKDIEILEIEKKNNFIYLIIALVFLLTSIVLFTLYANISKRKTYKLLEKQNQEIKQKNEEIKKKTETLLVTNTELRKLSIIARETNNAIMILDSNYDIMWINQGFTRMFGFTTEQLNNERGKNLLEISGNTDIYQNLKKVLFNKKTIIYDSQNTKRDGAKIWTQTTVTPIIDEYNNVTQLIAIDSDISQLKKAEKEITHQRDEIAWQKKEITDSIIYSKRIQNAILTSKENISQIIPDSFIIYIPKEIIGGDFYWMRKQGNEIIIAVADCTGHGVPGALMSMLGITLLNDIVE